jgi:hypothetical protein
MLERHSPSRSIQSYTITPTKQSNTINSNSSSSSSYINTSPSIHLNTPVDINADTCIASTSSATSLVSIKGTHESTNISNISNKNSQRLRSSHRGRSASSSRKSAVVDTNHSNLNVPVLGQFHSTPVRRKNH